MVPGSSGAAPQSKQWLTGWGGAKTYIALAIGLVVGAGVALMNSKRDHSPNHGDSCFQETNPKP